MNESGKRDGGRRHRWRAESDEARSKPLRYAIEVLERRILLSDAGAGTKGTLPVLASNPISMISAAERPSGSLSPAASPAAVATPAATPAGRAAEQA